MNYYEQNDRPGRVWGAIVVALYVVACAAVMLLAGFAVERPPEPESLLVEIVEMPEGVPDATGVYTDGSAAPASASSSEESSSQSAVSSDVPERSSQPAASEPVMTSDAEDAPAVSPPPAREVDRRALFPGTSTAAAASSQGASSSSRATASAGNGSGGSGAGGVGFDLEGRYGITPLPLPVHPGNNLSGRVVIRIVVDASGKVTSATYEQVGSTTNNGALVSAARAAALRTRFTEADAEAQSGTITYNFKLN